MNSRDIRQSFLDFFAQRGHLVQPSSPLVPHGDATLLFTNAGMVPFKSYFLGQEQPPSRRAVSVQKCLRVSGKHNDLEAVGPSPRHHTFFEMLGNFSFGDYFKEEAIEFAWELVTRVWGLPTEHLFATVFREDDEAWGLWKRISTLPAERILRLGEEDNFWAMGDTGPCGPCSEIYMDIHPDRPAVSWDEGSASGRYLEFWNLVFMQFERDATGALTPLPNPSIDTGAGLERVSAVIQRVGSNYDTDLFTPLLAATGELSNRRYGADADADTSLRVIADHLRAVAFLLADGVIPSNEGRGYVLRRVLRRAVRHGMRLGFAEPFLHRLLPVVDEALAGFYTELAATRGASTATVRAEEEKFLSTLAQGSRQVQEEIESARRAGAVALAGEAVFRLYDTHGLPLEIIREIAEEERMGFDQAGFEAELEGQRERSRSATGEGQKRVAELARAIRGAGETEPTRFAGYGSTTLADAQVVRLVLDAESGPVAAASLGAGQTGVAVFDRTVFYAEGGGEVGDTGLVRWPGGRARVTDTRKDPTGLFFHFLAVEEGTLAVGARVDLEVDPERRAAIQRNHTATHLLHAALHEHLGPGARQAGSLVAPDRLRFDFYFERGLTEAEKKDVEAWVERWVLAATATEIAERSHAEAVAAGAMALFGEKYGDRVRTVAIPGASLELCGGCHVSNTGEIGPFVILAERGIASGVRRIEALTGLGALAYLRERDGLLVAVAGELGVKPERAVEEAGALRERLKAQETELAKLRLQLVQGGSGGASAEVSVAGVPLVVREVPPAPAGELRNMADALRGKLSAPGVVVIGTREAEKAALIVAVAKELEGRAHAGKLVQKLAALVGGSGGGRADFAQAGGKEPGKLDEALAAAPGFLAEQLGT
jgi:alanyl-tRNA synthetase